VDVVKERGRAGWCWAKPESKMTGGHPKWMPRHRSALHIRLL
jgi:hypothetical protein